MSKKRFVILHDTCTKEQEEAVRVFVKTQAAWWHWLPNGWLLSDDEGVLSAHKLRDNLKELLPGVHMMVLEFSDAGDTWSGFGPTTKERNMFEWIRENWGDNKDKRP